MTELQLTRDQAYELVLRKVGPGNLLKHILAVEAGMRHLAVRFGHDPDYWGLVGLVHDLDYHETKDDPDRHAIIACEWLGEYDLPADMIDAIKAHPGHQPCRTELDWALFATDPATGFIVACALMHPEKRLDAIDEAFMLRRFEEKRFAAGASRENMRACAHLGLEVGPFLVLIQEAMLSIRDQLGL
jgi:putative nucleotidyltransferase with HDIG domain